jgi:hypothetical protein
VNVAEAVVGKKPSGKHQIRKEPNMDSIRRLMLVAVPLSLVALSGCSGIGPGTVGPSRFDYTAALGDSWKQQMLINMVKLRYGDAPVFMDVASVISQFQVAGQISWLGVFNNPPFSNTQTTGATGNYVDRPTITYMPLSGDKFTRTLMKPIPPPAVLSLIQAGYPVDLVLRFCVHSVNGIRNRYGGSARARHADPGFYPLLARLRKIQDSGAMGLRVQKTGEMEGVLMSLRGKVDASTQEDIDFVRRTLGLDSGGDEFRVAYGSVAKDGKELAILTRSVLEIIVDLASCIEVPAAHVQEKRVNPTMPDDTVEDAPVPPLIRVHSSRLCPGDAFLAVPYRNHWFWIDDRDLRSKSLFSFLLFVFSLTDTEGKEGAPIVTIPAG